jgi:hypothetical protein
MLLISLGLTLGCKAPPPEPAKAPAPTREDFQREETMDSCVDAWLTAHKLDSFGNPPDTNYPGGSPLIEEATGIKRDRFEYLFERFPELVKVCKKAGK